MFTVFFINQKHRLFLIHICMELVSTVNGNIMENLEMFKIFNDFSKVFKLFTVRGCNPQDNTSEDLLKSFCFY